MLGGFVSLLSQRVTEPLVARVLLIPQCTPDAGAERVVIECQLSTTEGRPAA